MLFVFWLSRCGSGCSSNVNQGTNFVFSESTRTKAAILHKYYSKDPLWHFMNTWRSWEPILQNIFKRTKSGNFESWGTICVTSSNLWPRAILVFSETLRIPFDHMSFTSTTKLPRLWLYSNFSKSRARFVIFSWYFVFFLNIRSCTFTNTKTHILWHYWLVFGLFGPILA